MILTKFFSLQIFLLFFTSIQAWGGSAGAKSVGIPDRCLEFLNVYLEKTGDKLIKVTTKDNDGYRLILLKNNGMISIQNGQNNTTIHASGDSCQNDTTVGSQINFEAALIKEAILDYYRGPSNRLRMFTRNGFGVDSCNLYSKKHLKSPRNIPSRNTDVITVE